MRMVLIGATLASAAAWGAATPVQAADLGSLAGKWCGTQSNYVFSRKTMSVRLHSGARRDFPITHADSNGPVVTVHWLRDGKRYWTKFTDFDPTGGMVQLPNEGGGRMLFHRC